ncbi:hypothetical protein NQ317_015283 [Molorchus minor]|uniref:Uncharacterized protein n=1 Tax=Molorchus minor TaxID=1323400 RepID=A0ABQ9IZ39_9CUCU|nr:hypothetical protein NQ317_015283 [Molorchus minor]
MYQFQDGKEIEQTDEEPATDFGLCAAQIVITAATPMMEEPEQPFPAPEETTVNHNEPASIIEEVIVEEPEETEYAKEPPVEAEPVVIDTTDDPEESMDDHPPESHFAVSSSTGSDGETTGPSTAENSVSQAPSVDNEPKQVVGGRASIPDELEPHQLARLQDLKESNA